MAIAALADIHGNVHALQAVLADPRFEAADQVVVLGDVVAGTFPAETLDFVVGLGERARILRGNADRIVLEEEGGEAAWVRERLTSAQLEAVRGLAALVRNRRARAGRGPLLSRDPSRRRGDCDPLDTEHSPGSVTRRHRGSGRDRWAHAHAARPPIQPLALRQRGQRWATIREHAGRLWALLGPDVKLVRTDYDVESAARAVLASGQPRAVEVAETLTQPPSPEEASAEFEKMRGG